MRLHFRVSLTTGRAVCNLAVLVVLLGALSAWFLGEELGLVVAALAGAAYALLLIGGILLANWLLLPRRARRTFEQQKALQDETRVQWSDEDISFTSQRGHSRFAWSDFVRIVEGQRTIILLQSDHMLNFIPRTALTSDQAAAIMRCAEAARQAR